MFEFHGLNKVRGIIQKIGEHGYYGNNVFQGN